MTDETLDPADLSRRQPDARAGHRADREHLAAHGVVEGAASEAA